MTERWRSQLVRVDEKRWRLIVIEIPLAILTGLRIEEHGQDLVEYALLLGLLGLASVAAVTSVAEKISSLFSTVGSDITRNT